MKPNVPELEHSHHPDQIAERLSGETPASYLRDAVYGGIDGAVTTFAVVAGVVGANLSANVILILGLANLLADGFSMAASNYSGTKAERDRGSLLRAMEARHIAQDGEGEREEVRQILTRFGIKGSALTEATETVSANEQVWIDFMMAQEHGFSPVQPDPLRAALMTFVAFAICGAVPLIPYVMASDDAFTVSIIATGAVFFTIGAAKSLWAITPWWRSGLETLLIGGTAAAIAYYVGKWLGQLVH